MKEDSPENALKKLASQSGITVSAAESCTGGFISHLITTVPGASRYFLGSVTSYSPAIKTKFLGVPPSFIKDNGIVSSKVAAAMAEGIRQLTGSTYSVSTTGWADKTGDEHEPAGTVWIGISGPSGTITERFHHSGDRNDNIKAFATEALKKLVLYIASDIKH